MYRKLTFLTALFCLTALVGQVRAADPVPQGAGRAEVIENELQKASGWAERQSEEQSQQNLQEFQQQHSKDIDAARNKFESDPTSGIMTDEHWQERGDAANSAEVSQDVRKKFTENNAFVLQKNQPQNYSDFSEEKAAQDAFEEHTRGPHQFEIIPEAYAYKYTENIGVKVTGIKGGLTSTYQYRLLQNDPIETWSDFLRDASKPNIFRLEGRMSYGKVDYEGSGTVDGIPDWNFETRGLVGMEVPVHQAFVFTPYAGLGYRYLFNDFSKAPAKFIGAQEYYSGYDRESSYLYIPLGLEAKTEFDQQWSFTVKGEFDIFVWGKQISHLEDMADTSGTNAGLDKLENTQKHGLGWRFSARVAREAGPIDLFIEPFIRFWHIEDSEVELITSGGSALCQGDLCSAGLEPDNKTWEYGLNMGAKF